MISDGTITYVGRLAKLALSEKERLQAKADMQKMLDYIDRLNEVDTQGTEPMTHLFPVENVFREDVVCEADWHEAILANAPAGQDGMFAVPQTFEG